MSATVKAATGSWQLSLSQTEKRQLSLLRTKRLKNQYRSFTLKAGAVVSALALLFLGTLTVQAEAKSLRVEEVVLVSKTGRHTIQAEIADTPVLRTRGLMFRQSMDADKGMLFLSEEPHVVTMWMKNTYISLDMIFITKDGRIHHIAKDAEPFSEKQISSKGKVIAVLELIGGSAKRLGLAHGDRVEHPFFAKN